MEHSNQELSGLVSCWCWYCLSVAAPSRQHPLQVRQLQRSHRRQRVWRTRHRLPVASPVGTVEIKKDASGNEYGMCTFKNGTSCEEWALYRGEGCKPGVTATPTVEAKNMVTFTEADNGKTESVTQNSQFSVVLAENPSTGFMWNATLSPGLELLSDYHKDDPSASRPGAAETIPGSWSPR